MVGSWRGVGCGARREENDLQAADAAGASDGGKGVRVGQGF